MFFCLSKFSPGTSKVQQTKEGLVHGFAYSAIVLLYLHALMDYGYGYIALHPS
jgi:hypothetical protein